jgi:dCMP deaminase
MKKIKLLVQDITACRLAAMMMSFPGIKKETSGNQISLYLSRRINAILNNIGMDLAGCKIYTALFPCNECAKAIIQSGINEVIYLSDKYEGNDIFKASKIMLDKAGVKYRKVEAKVNSILLSFDENVV